MIYLNVIFIVIAVMSIVFFVFHPKDVLGFWWVKGKNVVVGIFNLIKKWVK